MSVSLVLMLAAMSYFGTFSFRSSSSPVLIVFTVYKLVRYFQPFINNLPNPYVSTRASLTIFSECLLAVIASYPNNLSPIPAIVALILLFATFAIGLRCFSDFDKGLKDSKTDGQSYAPVKTNIDVFGD